MSFSNFFNNFTNGFMFGMLNSNPMFGCFGGFGNIGGFNSLFGGFGNFGIMGNLFNCNSLFNNNIFNTSFNYTVPMNNFNSNSIFSMPSTNTCNNIYSGFDFSTYWKSLPVKESSTSITTKENDSTKKEDSSESSTETAKSSNPESTRKASASLKGKHWTQMTDDELKQVYGNYDRKITNLYKGTEADLNKYLKGKGKLAGKGKAFLDAQKKYGISAAVLIGICMNESGGGTHLAAKNNVAGVRIAGSKNFRSFSSIEECIENVASNLKNRYLTPPEKSKKGVTKLDKLYLVNAKYCPSSDPTDTKKGNAGWAKNVEKYASEVDNCRA